MVAVPFKGSESGFLWFTVVHMYLTQGREIGLNALQISLS